MRNLGLGYKLGDGNQRAGRIGGRLSVAPPSTRAPWRRAVQVLTAVVAALALHSPSAHALKGDANGDGRVDIQDARLVADYLVGNVLFLPQPADADVNGDGRVSTGDALLILQFSKGLRTSFDFQAPIALTVLPANGAAGVLLTANISVFFSEPVSIASLNGGLTVKDAGTGAPVPGRIERAQDGVIATFFPDQPLSPFTTYRVDVSTGVKDEEDNALRQSFSSTFQTQALGTLVLISTNNTMAPINTLLAQPIMVKALSSGGSPVPQAPVVFSAQMGNGSFQPSGLRQLTVLTDNEGLVHASYKTGTQAILNSINISAVGFTTVPVFSVQTLPTPAVNLRLYTGDHQNGAPGLSPTFPLIVQATNAGGDAVSGTTVTFRVPQGQGSFGGQPTLDAITGSSGTAAAVFTFGSATGTVIVQASFVGMVGQGPQFTLFNLSPNPSSGTTIVGRVVDAQTLEPLSHVYVYLADAPSNWDWSDNTGHFQLTTTPGAHVVEVDGFESSPIGGNIYPVVAIPVNAVEGQVNDIGMPALLPRLDPQSYIDVSATQGGTLTLRSNPLWTLYIAPGSAHFANGSTTGRIYVADVPADKIPMPVAGGKISRFFDTIQPLNVRFDPPAPVAFPNSDNLPPGTVTEIFTLSYTSGTFTQTGRGKVSENGLVINSLPGEGITAGGWHNSPDPIPSPLYCIRTLLRLGYDVLAATLTAYGRSTAGSKVAQAFWEFLLCGLPSNQGPSNPILEIVTEDPSHAPHVAGSGGGGGGGGSGGGGSGGGNPQPPFNGPPDTPKPPDGDENTLPTITGLDVQVSTDAISGGGAAQVRITVLFDRPPARKDGIPIRIIDTPGNLVVFDGTPVPGIADGIRMTDGNAQVVLNVAFPIAFAAGVGVAEVLLDLTFVVEAVRDLAATVIIAQAVSKSVKMRLKKEYEIDTDALRNVRELRPNAPAITAFLNQMRNFVFISPQAFDEFTNFPGITETEKTARLGILASFNIRPALPPNPAIVAQFNSTNSTTFDSPGDAEVFASAAEHKRPLITSDQTAVNAVFFTFRHRLPPMECVLFPRNGGGPLFYPGLYPLSP